MESFSKRMGIESNLPIQKNEISKELRNRIWNIIFTLINEGLDHDSRVDFIKMIWDVFFKLPLDELDRNVLSSISFNTDKCISKIKEQFKTLTWNRVYDFMELFASTNFFSKRKKTIYIKNCNAILESENSAYKFHNQDIIERISESEMTSVDIAIAETPDIVSSHLKKSVVFLFDKQKPDYENSAKEAISAIEAFCREVSGSDKPLSELLKDGNLKLYFPHPLIKDLVSKLYAYRGERSGVGHSTKNEAIKMTKEEAIFILVTTSATINFMRCSNK